MYHNESNFILNQFQASVFGEILWTSGYLCFNAGWKTDPILFTIDMLMTFKDCYKNILLSACDLSNWLGDDAKIFEYCDNSNNADISLYKWNPYVNS